ncbi:lysogenic conversion protein [Pantoea agglomerans]|uniref:lysogenic conversion protein n=1 Tax=Enterobacter agglomerans TaxID=549 RepID=UPI00289C552F|nr:lysogenic conversion protein [Pantoea agglomerans]WNK34920.1 lysogenic conversion protein [Pantoea agglomerans]
MMTNPLSWENWSEVYLNKKHNKRASLERWGLRNLHSVEALDHIVSEVKNKYLHNNPHIKVTANSVWVDGTPQAKFTVSNYKRVYGSLSAISGNATQPNIRSSKDEVLNCELADLLFIFNEFNNQNGFKRVRAVLLQGKCADKNNVLPDGPSTEKERKLFELVNRNKELTLYPGTKVSGDPIGSYTLGGHVSGLADCAKYLMMPKHEKWNYKAPENIGPYVIGWPESLTSKSLGETSNYLDAVIHEMLQSQTMGKEVKFDNGAIDRTCEWSAMIEDLLTCYHAVTMKGYDRQRRFYRSSEDIPEHIEGLFFMATNNYFNKSIRINYDNYVKYLECKYGVKYKKIIANKIKDNIGRYIDYFFSERGPIISTIVVNVNYREDESLRD